MDTEDEQPCCICQKVPDEYIQLACSHSFCLVCLSMVMMEQSQNQEDPNLITVLCVICQQLTELDHQSLETLSKIDMNQIEQLRKDILEQSERKLTQETSLINDENQDPGQLIQDSQEENSINQNEKLEKEQFHQDYKQNNKMMNSKFIQEKPGSKSQINVRQTIDSPQQTNFEVKNVNSQEKHSYEPQIPKNLQEKEKPVNTSIDLKRLKQELRNKFDCESSQKLQNQLQNIKDNFVDLDRDKRKFLQMVQEFQEETQLILQRKVLFLIQIQTIQKQGESFFNEKYNIFKKYQDQICDHIDLYDLIQEILQKNQYEQILQLQLEVDQNKMAVIPSYNVQYQNFDDRDILKKFKELKQYIMKYSEVDKVEEIFFMNQQPHQNKPQDLNFYKKNILKETMQEPTKESFQIQQKLGQQNLPQSFTNNFSQNFQEFERKFDQKYNQILYQQKDFNKSDGVSEDIDNISNYEMKSPVYMKDFKSFQYPTNQNYLNPNLLSRNFNTFKDSFENKYKKTRYDSHIDSYKYSINYDFKYQARQYKNFNSTYSYDNSRLSVKLDAYNNQNRYKPYYHPKHF